jgi:hypothetical protein
MKKKKKIRPPVFFTGALPKTGKGGVKNGLFQRPQRSGFSFLRKRLRKLVKTNAKPVVLRTINAFSNLSSQIHKKHSPQSHDLPVFPAKCQRRASCFRRERFLTFR